MSILGAVLFAVRSYSLAYFGLLIVGIVVFVVGLLWPKPKPREPPRQETE